MSDSLLHFCVFSSLGFEGLLLAVPALILQLLQLLQDSSGLVRGVDQHAQQLEAKGEKVQIKKKNKLPLQLRNSQEKNREPTQRHEEKRTGKTNTDRRLLTDRAHILSTAHSQTVSGEIKQLFC